MSKMPVRTLLRKTLPSSVYGHLRDLKNSPARVLQWTMDACGFVVARKSDYYSPLPSRRRLKSTMARWAKPSSLLGVAYDLAGMKVMLADLVDWYHEEFMGLLPYKEALALGFGPGYTRLDALVLYAMLRARKPARYVEVGSGLSTYYASLAGQRNASEGRPMRGGGRGGRGEEGMRKGIPAANHDPFAVTRMRSTGLVQVFGGAGESES
jgi:hypothetical protein